MRYLLRTAALLISTLVISAAAAHADTLYTFSATGTPYGNITTVLSASPTPASFNATSFHLNSIPVTVDGDLVSADIDFYTLAAGGGAGGTAVGQSGIVGGPQLFTGTTANPTFLTGTFPLHGFDLTISATAVPEPSSIALIGTGALGLVGAFRRRFNSGV